MKEFIQQKPLTSIGIYFIVSVLLGAFVLPGIEKVLGELFFGVFGVILLMNKNKVAQISGGVLVIINLLGLYSNSLM